MSYRHPSIEVFCFLTATADKGYDWDDLREESRQHLGSVVPDSYHCVVEVGVVVVSTRCLCSLEYEFADVGIGHEDCLITVEVVS